VALRALHAARPTVGAMDVICLLVGLGILALMGAYITGLEHLR